MMSSLSERYVEMSNSNKKHLITMDAGNGRKMAVWVTGATFDGRHYRVSAATWAECHQKLAEKFNVGRGEGILS